MSSVCRQNSLMVSISAILMIAGLLGGCNGNTDTPPTRNDASPTHNWQRITVAQVEQNGTARPFVVARQAAGGHTHIAYYNTVIENEDAQYQQLIHLIWNPAGDSKVSNVVQNRPAPSGVMGFDRSEQFDFALDINDTPVFIYPAYEINTYLQQAEADIMVNLYEAGQWNEATGAVGFVDRNPVYQDGQTSENMSLAMDSQGNIHFCYQYYTEGMDSANFRYPDLYYAFRQRQSINIPITDITQYSEIEELVDGNAFSSYGVHNSVGYFCKLILDETDRPYIFYAEHGENFMGTFALKMAFKDDSGQWQRQTIETLEDGWQIGAISPAFVPPDPENPDGQLYLAVAYALRSPAPEPDNAHRLMYATNRDGRWISEIVDESTWCGLYCSLAFTPDGQPAIAYLDEQSHSGRPHQFLKYAKFNGLMWIKESAAEQGSVGLYNTLWFDAQAMPNICTFSDENNEILVVRQIN